MTSQPSQSQNIAFRSSQHSINRSTSIISNLFDRGQQFILRQRILLKLILQSKYYEFMITINKYCYKFMHRINPQLNTNFPKNHLRRTLLRTESSLQKIVETNRQDSIKKIKYFMQNHLRYCSLQKSIQKQKSNNPTKLGTQTSQISLYSRQKTRKLFIKSKIVSSNQSFLSRINKETRSKLQQLTEEESLQKYRSSVVRTNNSVKDIDTNTKTSAIDQKQTTQNSKADNKQAHIPVVTRYRTISYDQQSPDYVQRTSQKNVHKTKRDQYYNKVSINSSSFKVRLQRFNQDNIKIELPQSTLQKLPQFQPTLVTFQPSHTPQVQKVQISQPQIANSEYKQNKSKQNAFLDQQIDALYANVPEIQTKERSASMNKKQTSVRLNQSRQNVYKEAEDKNQFYIEEIIFVNTSTDFKNQNVSDQDHKIHDENHIIKDQNRSIHIQHESNKYQNVQKYNTGDHFDTKNVDFLLPQSSRQDDLDTQLKQCTWLRSQQSNRDETFKQMIIQKTNKINVYRQQLQIFGQLAGFFSKNSKVYKINKQSQCFIKDGSVTWHLLLYFFFKYFYSMNVLFLKYYRSLETKITIDQQKMNEYAQQIQKLGQTLKKIQNSTRKASLITEAQQHLIANFDYLQELQKSQTLNQIIDFYLNNCKQQIRSAFVSFLKDLRISIFNQVAKFVKNMKIGNILNQQNNVSVILYDGLFRIFNSCVILYQFYQFDSQRLQTITQVQKLTHVSTELFQKFYIKVSGEILGKRR